MPRPTALQCCSKRPIQILSMGEAIIPFADGRLGSNKTSDPKTSSAPLFFRNIGTGISDISSLNDDSMLSIPSQCPG